MNILYVIFTFETGGIQKLLIDIINKLVKDNNIYLCVINKRYDTCMLEKIDRRAEIILLNRTEHGQKIKYMFQYTKFILEHKIDIIHCQLENSVKFSALAKILNPRIKIFTTVHETNAFKYLKYYEVLLDRLLCRKIIAISECVRDEILSKGIPQKKVVTIYNAINMRKFMSFQGKHKKNKRIVIGNVSRIVPEKKGQDILINAIAKLKERYTNILCLFAGECPNDKIAKLDELKQLCILNDVEDNVKFLGNVNNISRFLDNIDIFVLPSRSEGFGIALIEAMAKGVPCIASDIDGPKEIIKNSEYGLLFQHENADALAQKIEFRINNMEIETEKIRNYIIDNYSIDCMINRILNVYDT
jgi:glycosyltransferase involved in cell wall biosynthesis